MDALLSFAEKLLLILASIPGSYRPDTDGKPPGWEKSLQDVLTVDRGWPLSLLVAGWYFDKHRPAGSQALATLRGLAGVQNVWQRFDNAKIHDQLDTACKEAFEAQQNWELAGAAASFDFVLKDASGINVGQVVEGLFFRVLAKSILDAFPPASDLEARIKVARGEQAPAPNKSAATPPPQPTARPSGASSQLGGSRPVATRPPATSIATPQLSEYDQTVAYLASRGYTKAQIEALCGSPDEGLGGGKA